MRRNAYENDFMTTYVQVVRHCSMQASCLGNLGNANQYT